MKAILILINLTICIAFNGIAQQYKVKYISYKSEIKNELDGYTLAMYKYENSKVSIINKGKDLKITGTKDAVMLRFFQQLPWNKSIKSYANGIHAEDKGEKTSYYVQASVSKDLKTIDLRILNRNGLNNQVIDDVIIIYKRI